MSISRIHTLVEKWGVGCGVLLALAFALSMLAYMPQCGAGRPTGEIDQGAPLAQVGDFPISSAIVQVIYDNKRAQQGAELTPERDAQLLGESLQSAIETAHLHHVAKREGVLVTEQSAPEAITSLFNQSLRSQRQLLELTGQLKPNASEKEFAEALQKMTGQTPEQARQQFESEYKLSVEDPVRRPMILAQLSNYTLRAKYEREAVPSDEELRRSFESRTFKRILFKSGDEGRAQAQKALEEIRGGLGFEQAMDRYSTEPAEPGKKRSERTQVLMASYLQGVPDYQPLLALKPGEVSDVITEAGSVSIYKLIKAEPKLPKDFEQRKDQYRQEVSGRMASAKLDRELKAVRESVPITWKSKAYETLYSYQRLLNDPSVTADERKRRLREISQEARGLMENPDPMSGRVAALAHFSAQNTLWNEATPAEREAMTQERIQSIETALANTENFDLRLELVDLYAKQNKGEEATRHLVAVAQANLDPTENGQRLYNLVAAKLALLKRQNLIPADQQTGVQQELERWRKLKREQDQFEAEQKRQQAEAEKRFREEQKKNAATAPKGATGGGTTSGR